jgi:hypothetical protein
MRIAQLFKNIFSRIIIIIFCPLPFLWWIFVSIPTGIIREIRYQTHELNDAYKHYFNGYSD